MLFHQIQDAIVILRNKGVYRQTAVFRRGPRLYAKWGSGFIGLAANNGTTLPNVSWDHIEGAGNFAFDNIGRMVKA